VPKCKEKKKKRKKERKEMKNAKEQNGLRIISWGFIRVKSRNEVVSPYRRFDFEAFTTLSDRKG